MTQRGISIVDFEVGRADELVRMWRESFEFGVGVTDPHPLEEQRHYLMTTVVPHYVTRVALADEAIVGFVAANRESIAQLYVRIDRLRSGIGTRLLDWAKVQSSGSLWLFTFARNANARAFYEKHGFRATAHGFEPTWQLEDVRYEWKADAKT